jgi:hypothetical protein
MTTRRLVFVLPFFLIASSFAGSTTVLFDGKTLDGWTQDPPYATTIGGGDITDLPGLEAKIAAQSDPVSTYLNSQLDDAAKQTPDDSNTKALKSALSKQINKLINGALLYDKTRFAAVQLRQETSDLLNKNPTGMELARLNRMLLEDAYPKELARSAMSEWIVKDGAMASTGAGRGVIFTKDDYSHYRMMFTMRHVSGNPDHEACVLIFCMRPPDGEKGLDALGGIQFQVPNGGHWDYRKGHNNGGKGEYTSPDHPKFDKHNWSRVEILVDATKGIARMAVAQPVDAKAVEVLDFNVPEAGKTGPFALQIHNGGLFDEYKDISIEVDPAVDDLVTTK